MELPQEKESQVGMSSGQGLVAERPNETQVARTPEQELAAERPIAVNLENEDLDNARTAQKTDMFDSAGVHHFESEHESWVSSSEEEEGTEENESCNPDQMVLVQALAGEYKIEECNDNKNNQGICPEKVSYGVKPRLLTKTEPDIITDNMVQQRLRRAPRYFDCPEYSFPSTNETSEREKHKKKKKRKRCYICGNIGHGGKQCKRRKCFICSMKGHLITDCPMKNVEVDSPSRLCLKCGSTGHDMFSCSYDYNSEDLKGIQCYICNEFGHLCCVDNVTEGTSEASCYHCGESGHFGSDCIKLKEVANNDLELCSKCGQKGHLPQPCIGHHEGGKAKKKKPRRRREDSRRNPVPALNAYQYQANMAPHWYSPPVAGSYYGGPGSPSVPALNAYQYHANMAPHWYRPPIVGPYYGRPGSHVWLSPAAAAARGLVNHQNEDSPSHQIFNNQVGTQLPHNCFHPMTLFIPSPQQPLHHQTGVQISQTITQQVPQSMINQIASFD